MFSTSSYAALTLAYLELKKDRVWSFRCHWNFLESSDLLPGPPPACRSSDTGDSQNQKAGLDPTCHHPINICGLRLDGFDFGGMVFTGAVSFLLCEKEPLW